jgi:hypothetical protein
MMRSTICSTHGFSQPALAAAAAAAADSQENVAVFCKLHPTLSSLGNIPRRTRKPSCGQSTRYAPVKCFQWCAASTPCAAAHSAASAGEDSPSVGCCEAGGGTAACCTQCCRDCPCWLLHLLSCACQHTLSQADHADLGGHPTCAYSCEPHPRLQRRVAFLLQTATDSALTLEAVLMLLRVMLLLPLHALVALLGRGRGPCRQPPKLLTQCDEHLLQAVDADWQPEGALSGTADANTNPTTLLQTPNEPPKHTCTFRCC